MARIRIEDLPALAHLTPEELEEIFGAGSKWARLSLEALEERQLLDAGLTASLQGSLLSIQDTTAGNTLHLHQANNQISLDGISINTSQGSAASVPVSQISHIDLYLLGGSEHISLDT
jgi:hypothetical protein